MSSSEAKSVISKVKGRKLSSAGVAEVIDFVQRNGGIDAAQQKALALRDEAVAHLDAFQDSVYKSSLRDFANFVVIRPK